MSKRKHFWASALIILFLFAAGCSGSTTTSPANSPQAGQMRVCFLDVGQADSILVQMPNGQNMLVDAGNNDDGTVVVKYLKQYGVKQINYLIGTHPHEDHIGGLDTVIKSFKVGKVYMPQVTSTTRTFEDVLQAVRAKGLKITPARAGVQIVNSGKLNVTVLAPNKTEYEDINNYSAVIKVTYNQVSFLLTGDAGEQSEAEMLLGSVISPKADVLKVGHHGSRDSTSEGFLKTVNPRYAVISVGAGNDYGHPHKETLEKLRGINVFRTDINGTIIFTTDGKEINVTTEKPSPGNKPDTPARFSGKMYVDSGGRGLIKGNINSKGEKIYHLPGGAYYEQTKAEKWFKTEEQARAAGFRPSKR
ncbi:MBL fold metallo-hydrolase [Desulfotruncus alcoholivorax]|uniref:MBL fold metallo-hydrolase n=1 Tax=Desulfotruncus alcoholivorax TaxID=265477 RepID=UPI000488A399|nr:MBL fold metallo-hydrolase [Desulfotruncus alcoholivorax]